MFYKPEIRKKLRAKRQQLDNLSIEQAAKQVAAQVIYLYKFIESKTIGIYLPQENELDTIPIIHCAIDQGKQLFLPVISKKKKEKVMSFYSYHPEDTLIKNHFGILEPDIKTQASMERADLDILFIPLVGFDDECNRLGRGAGYYDYTLNFIKKTANKGPLLIGLGYEFQKITHIVPSKWDVPLDYVFTEEKMYQRV